MATTKMPQAQFPKKNVCSVGDPVFFRLFTDEALLVLKGKAAIQEGYAKRPGMQTVDEVFQTPEEVAECLGPVPKHR